VGPRSQLQIKFPKKILKDLDTIAESIAIISILPVKEVKQKL